MAAMRSGVALVLMFLTGCGTHIPELEEFSGERGAFITPDGLLEFEIKAKVYCEIMDAVISNREANMLPHGWAAQLTMSLQVDETGAVNPGISFINPLSPGETFTLGLGATLSSQATREDKLGNYWYLDHLTGKTHPNCTQEHYGNSRLLEGDLGIKKYLTDQLKSENFIPSSPLPKDTDSSFKQVALTYHLKFIVITSGTATPSWKLVKLTSGNGNLPLITANRTRTHELVLTFGSAYKAGTPNNALTQHEATLFNITRLAPNQ